MALALSIFNGLNLFLPYRGFFRIRRLWLAYAGLSVESDVRIAAGARFYGKRITWGGGHGLGRRLV